MSILKKLFIYFISFVAVANLQANESETISFTNSTVVALPSAQEPVVSSNQCPSKGVCDASLTYPNASVIGGEIVVTATDGKSCDMAALAHQSSYKNAGLGVVTGVYKGNYFRIIDHNYSLDKSKEKLTISFEKEVSIDAIYFFPDDRRLYSLTHELDYFDGFTVSIDGSEFVPYTFGKDGGQPKKFVTPIVGKTFTFAFAKYMSIEDYYIGAITISTPCADSCPIF